MNSSLLRVMIVDDHAIIREALHDVMQKQQMQVVALAHNGQEAVELYRQHQPDITLMDIHMPVMDGLAATRQILAEFPNARIIVVTNADADENVCLQAGVKALCYKDGNTQELIATVRRVHQAQD